jgi:gag-polypeptide of LTR copia-type
MATNIVHPIQFNHQLNTILGPENYLIWKSQVLPVLRGHGLIAYIDGSSSLPNDIIPSSTGIILPNPNFERWHQQDQHILAWMFQSISHPTLAQVINCNTSLQLWQVIQHSHTSHSLAKMLELKLLLQTSKKGSLSCAQFLQHIQSLVDRLRSIGSDVSDQDMVLFTLQGIGSDFETFVTVISLRHQPLTMQELHSILLAHEARLLANLRIITSSQTVHLTTPAASSPSPPISANSYESLALYAGSTSQKPFFWWLFFHFSIQSWSL